MDSLLASYASSDEEEDQQQEPKSILHETSSMFNETPQTSRTLSSLPEPRSSSSTFSSLPQPKSSSSAIPSLPPPKCPSSNFSSLPQTKSSVFSSLPPPKSTSNFSSPPPPVPDDSPLSSNPLPSDSKPKRIVQFRPPLVLKPFNGEDDDDDDEEEKQRKRIKESNSSGPASSLNSFFSSLPAPKNTLGFGSVLALGAGRRSIVETIVPTSNYDGKAVENKGSNSSESRANYDENCGDGSSSISTSEVLTTVSDPSNINPSMESYESYGYHEDNGNYGDYEINYANYGGVATIAPTTSAPDTSGFFESVARMPGKRGRNEIPAEIVEVKQDELMKNRPREDQVKSTGIAFGPSYQPVSTKGKPSKLHKRKHQIGSLFFDMKQKELELAERRSKGFLTKAETHAKYGW
ncbi:mitotic checkpoint protein PRCC-carboxy-term protein [Thalictrum thalictroides]|uniref:Mitotic checkpoint protein PRCC-carboxy-term protein n=1 Tax=Thalictrum thalictroides TaxID=46969 RepID=A0A7J6V3M4_THATH|nr:mitotic checkpoint protein PRCC-carboxy-term protein [Thalictrum thalictroides]